MNASRWQNAVPRAVVIPAVFALGAVAAIGLRGNAVEPPPPVQPSVQALSTQNSFEQVAEKLRPSVVFIQSRQTIKSPAQFRQEQFDGNGGFVFPFQGGPNGGLQIPRNGQGFNFGPSYPRRAVASGSGVIVRSDGYILTNDHVVEGADKVTVHLQDGREFVGQVRRDFRSDLALVKIPANNLPAAEMGDSDKVKIGQWAIAFGSPFNLSDTMTVGVVSSLHRQEAIGEGTDGRFYSSLIQTDASINPGNSGGPLVDIYGRVVGLNVAIESPSGTNAGIGFAIPANTARYIVDQLINKGSVTRGYLGLVPVTPTFDEKQQYGVTDGALVRVVDDSSPAARAGFQVGDVIVRYNGKPIMDDVTLRDMVARSQPGTRVDVIVKRDGHNVSLTPTIEAAPAEKIAAATDQTPDRETPRGKLGVQVANASDADVRQQLGLKDTVKSGAAIVSVIPGSPAQEAGLQSGDLVTRLNGKPIADAQQLTDVARGLKSGSVVPVVVRRQSPDGHAQTLLLQITLE
ncbi:MAG TPA: trypsin-like peptidase domain-containing protein [Chthonomonadaceae bacterium]|nr:trypsin-like peptidase domain-containing protein [Chthonomonadaceae bacterium]